jgi:hypothetical protein
MTDAVVVVLGIMGQSPFAGVGWQVLHYLEGFRRLGYDVYYVEDTGEWPYDPERNMISADGRCAAAHIERLMGWCGLADRWAYRAAAEGGRVYGLDEDALARVVGRARTLVNVTGATVLYGDYLKIPARLYVETDPVQNQVEVAEGRDVTIERLGSHTHRFTFGENLGTPACDVPVERFTYRPTRQPVVLDWWRRPEALGAAGRLRFTTVASWRQRGKDVQWNGHVYAWSKHAQFLRFLDLPARAPTACLELALAGADGHAVTLLQSRGWAVRDAVALSRDILPYRDHVWGSDAEFTVAKDQYVLPRSGWFSDRSACYLAAGKPVVTQDTGFGRVLPTGRGLLAFTTADDALAAIEAVASDYAGHARAAREIAAEYFAADRVLARIVAEVQP